MDIRNKLCKGKKFFGDKDYRTLYLASHGFYNRLSDKEFVELIYPLMLGKTLNLENPQTFNEKVQWLKLYDHRPEYTIMVDKYKARKYIANEIGEEYLVPLLGVWKTPEDIDFEALPEQFVLKCNHNSGLGMCICKDKSKLNIKKVKSDLKKGLKEDYYRKSREWPYKDVPRRIICEKYLKDQSGKEMIDYKLNNFNGVPQFFVVCSKRFSNEGLHEDYYTTKWEKMDVKRCVYETREELEEPVNLEKMLNISKKLSKGYPYMRIDFYEINGKLYVGEITLYHSSGFGKLDPEEYDMIFGNMLTLPEITQLSVPPRGV